MYLIGNSFGKFYEKGGFQLMQILGRLGMFFDAAVVFVKKFSLQFRLALAKLCTGKQIRINFGAK